jgi:hypothetical protein
VCSSGYAATDTSWKGCREQLSSGSLTYNVQCVDQACSRNDGGAVLVVVEHWDVHAVLRLTLNVEALRRL